MDTTNLKAISIRQPWAHHILHDGKDVENRSWPTKFRGQVLIHASKTFDGDAAEKRAFIEKYGDKALFGGIIGVMEITDCVTALDDSRWFNGPYGFVLKPNPIEIPFVACKGALGFFRPQMKETP